MTRSPHSTLLRSLGEAGEIEPESEAYLLENKVDFEDFSPAVLDCLPKDLPWTIPQVCSLAGIFHPFQEVTCFSIICLSEESSCRDIHSGPGLSRPRH